MNACKSHGFRKLAFRLNETAVLEVNGSQIRFRKSEKRDQKTDVILYSSLVGFWSVLGRILGPKIDQKSIKKSIEFRNLFWEALLKSKRVGGVKMSLLLSKSKVLGINVSKKSFQRGPINGLFWDPFWVHFGIIFGVDFRTDFWNRFGTVLGRLGSRLGSKFEPKR